MPRRFAALVGLLLMLALGSCAAQSPTTFRYAIDDGVERLLYLSGGTVEGPVEIRVIRGAAVAAQGPTVPLHLGIIDVCRNNPPQDARWWSARIDDALARAIRAGDPQIQVEGLISGTWVPLRIRDSGCKWKGG